MITCQNCGHQNESIFRYCIKCGHELSVTQESKAAVSKPKAGFYVYPIRKDGKVGDPVALVDGSNIIGRSPDARIQILDDRWVEDRHAEINVSDDTALISDLDSTFGTYVRIRVEKELENNDEIRIGQALFRVELPWPELMSGPDDTPWLGTQEAVDDVFGRLLRIGPGDTVIQGFLLHGDSVIIGRKQGSIRLCNDPVVSGKHAEIVPKDPYHVVLRDLGSLNGSYFRVRDSYPLGDGDYFLTGGRLMLFRKLNGQG